MSWEQFEKPELDGRLQLIAGYLADKLDGKQIVDLNCGTAPLLKWLPKDRFGMPLWALYYGNDTHAPFILEAEKRDNSGTIFQCRPDTEVTRSLKTEGIEIDILLCLGYGARLNEHESQTLDNSIGEIVLKFHPEIVIIEYWSGMEADDLLGYLMGLGYILQYKWIVDTIMSLDKPEKYTSRTVSILEVDND